MKHLYKHLFAAGLLAAMAMTAGAQTPSGPGASAGPTAERGEHHGRFAARMQERMARRQAELKLKLQLTPAQEGAWQAFTAAMKPPANLARPERGELAKLTTPERIDRMRSMRAARAAEMDKRADAAKAFYAALSPDQKKVFDAETAPGRFARHHGGPGFFRG
jgi:periplasmic protein CpxP/Spy